MLFGRRVVPRRTEPEEAHDGGDERPSKRQKLAEVDGNRAVEDGNVGNGLSTQLDSVVASHPEPPAQPAVAAPANATPNTNNGSGNQDEMMSMVKSLLQQMGQLREQIGTLERNQTTLMNELRAQTMKEKAQEKEREIEQEHNGEENETETDKNNKNNNNPKKNNDDDDDDENANAAPPKKKRSSKRKKHATHAQPEPETDQQDSSPQIKTDPHLPLLAPEPPPPAPRAGPAAEAPEVVPSQSTQPLASQATQPLASKPVEPPAAQPEAADHHQPNPVADAEPEPEPDAEIIENYISGIASPLPPDLQDSWGSTALQPAPERVVRAEGDDDASISPDLVAAAILAENPNIVISWDNTIKTFILSHAPESPELGPFTLVPNEKAVTAPKGDAKFPVVRMHFRPHHVFDKDSIGVYYYILWNFFQHLAPVSFSIAKSGQHVLIEFESEAKATEALKMNGWCITDQPYCIAMRRVKRWDDAAKEAHASCSLSF